VETGKGRRRMQQSAAPGTPGQLRRSGWEVDTRRAPWDVSVVVVRLLCWFAVGTGECRMSSSFLTSRSCEVCVSVFIQT